MVNLQNEGNTADTFTIYVATDNANGLTARYFLLNGDTETEITDGFVAGSWTTPSVSTGTPLSLRVELTLDNTVAIAESRELTLTAASVGDNTMTDAVKLVVTRSPLSEVTLITSLPSPQSAANKSPITLTAQAASGVPVEYQFQIKHEFDFGYTPVQAYSTDNTYDWRPTLPGVYSLLVWAREVGSTEDFQASTAVDFTIAPAVDLTAAPASPWLVNKPVLLTATPYLGNAAEFQFLVQRSDAPDATIIRTYGAGNTCSWTPTQAGDYTLTVQAREQGSTDAYQVARSIPFVVATPLSAVALAADPVSPVVANTPVALTATSTGGARVEYQFRIKKSTDANYTVAQAYSLDNTYDWMPADPGTYYLVVWAREQGSVSSYQAYAAKSFVVAAPLSGVALSANPPSPALANTPVTLIATPTGGAKVQYRFFVKADADADYTPLQGYGDAATCPWTPATADGYTLRVQAREQGSANDYDAQAEIPFKVNLPLSAVSLDTDPVGSAVANTLVELTAIPTGGMRVECQFRVKKSTDAAYTVLQGYGKSKLCAWTPAQTGTYYLVVWAREAGSTAAYQVAAAKSFTVTLPLTGVALAASPASPAPAFTTVKLTATPTGGAQVEYQFMARPVGTTDYTILRPYETGTTCEWKPASGSYQVVVWARNAGSTADYDFQAGLNYTVAKPLAGVALAIAPGTTVAVATPVTLTATPTEGAQVQYQFRVRKSTAAAYTVLQGYNADNDCSWTPTEAGTYYVVVWAKEPGCAYAYQVYAAKTVTVTPP